MISSLTHRPRPTDTDAVLRLLAPIIDASGIATTLEGAAKPKAAAGAPVRHGQYAARGVLIAMFHAAYAGRPASLTELCALMWCDYTEEQLAYIGLGDLRNPDRVTEIKSNDKAWRNEHQRLWQYLQGLFEPIDDTARAANSRMAKTASKEAQEIAAVELADQARLRRKVLNDLITATIDPTLLADWKGDLAIDEHVVHVAKEVTNYFGDEAGKAAATPMANSYYAQRRVGSGWSVGLTRAVATSRPYAKRVPTVCVALDINGSSSGSAKAATQCLDQFEASSIRPSKGRNDRTYLVTDQAYSGVDLFNADVLERGYTLLMNYASDAKVLHDLGKHVDADAEVPGPYLYRGTFLCPAAKQALRGAGVELPKPTDTKEHVQRFNEEQDRLRPFEMPLNGLPQVTQRRRPGRPSKSQAQDAERVVKVRVQCPAAAGKVRCPIQGPEAWLDPKNQHLPSIANAAPVDNWPAVCDNANTTITLTPKAFKQYQPVMEGSWDHEEWMSINRSRDEGFNSVLTSTEGGNLQDRSLYARRNPLVSLTIAFAVGRANLKIQDKWRETLRLNYGVAPNEPSGRLREGANRRSAA